MQLGNLLEMALSLLPAVNFLFRRYEGQERNAIGVMVPKYGAAKMCRGMVQPVQRSKYEALGLNFAKNYINVWGSIGLDTMCMQDHPDIIVWNGWEWKVTAVNEWNQYNGWVNVTAVQDRRVDRENGDGQGQ